MLSEKIIKFLKDRPLISVKGLEQTLSIPDSTIRRAMVGLRNIPKKHYESICNELKKYGFSDEIFPIVEESVPTTLRQYYWYRKLPK